MTQSFLIEEFAPLSRNSLLGFARVRTPSGMVFHEVGVYRKNGSFWASPASKPRIGRDGVQMKDSASKPIYTPFVTFSSKDIRDRWSNAVIDAMRVAHPEVLA